MMTYYTEIIYMLHKIRKSYESRLVKLVLKLRPLTTSGKTKALTTSVKTKALKTGV